MTPKELAMLEYLTAYNETHKRIPTIKQLAYEFSLDRSVINKLLKSLADKGKLVRVIEPEVYKFNS